MNFLFLVVLFTFNALAAEIRIEQAFPDNLPTEAQRADMHQRALRSLVSLELTANGIKAEDYQKALDQRFLQWKSNLQQRQQAAELPIIAGSLSEFVDLSQFFTGLATLKFAPKEQGKDVWEYVLQGQADTAQLTRHAQLIMKPGPLGKKLLLSVEITPMNFLWEDLQLKEARDFVLPVQTEWVKWFADGKLPPGVDEIVPCLASCQSALNLWRKHDEKLMQSFVSPELMGHQLLQVDMKLERQLSDGPAPDTRMSISGGVTLVDLDSKERLHWLDLSPESRSFKAGPQKEFNSNLATMCYRAPLGKFLEFKSLAPTSAMSRQTLLVRLMNPQHMGQPLRLLEWMKAKGKNLNVEGKLDSFNRREAILIVRYVGEGKNFKSLVSNLKELESEWGKPITVTEQGEELVLALP